MMISRTGSKQRIRNSEFGIRNEKQFYSALSTLNSAFGLTLVEVLVSITILSIGSVFILQSLGKGSQALAIANKRSKAYAFSAAKLADMEMSYRNEGPEKVKGHFGSGQDRFNWHLERIPTVDSPELILVTLVIDWRIGQHSYESRYSTVQRVPVEEE